MAEFSPRQFDDVRVRRLQDELTPLEFKFCENYLQSDNALQAYKDASGCKPNTAKRQAVALLKRDHVIKYLKARKHQILIEVGEGIKERVLKEERALAFATVADFFDSSGNVLKPHDLPERAQRAVASFKVLASGDIEYKFYAKSGALERISRHLGLYEKDNDQARPIMLAVDPRVDKKAALAAKKHPKEKAGPSGQE